MSRSLPLHPSLEYLKKQAKALLAAHRAGDTNVCKSFRLLHRFSGADDSAVLAADVALHDAQLAVATDYGFASWAKLKAHVEKLAASIASQPYDPHFRVHPVPSVSSPDWIRPRIVSRRGMILMGLEVFGNPYEGGGRGIHQLWERFEPIWTQEIGHIPHVADPNVGYELHADTWDHDKSGNSYVMAGVELTELGEIPLEMFVRVLPPATYALFTLLATEMRTNWVERMFQEWLPSSGYERAAKPGYILETYDGARFKGMGNPESQIDILLPIRRSESRT